MIDRGRLASLQIDHDAYLQPVQRAGPMVSVPADANRDVVIDLAKATVVGFVPGHAIAIDLTGDVLLGGTTPEGLLHGPLRWHTPQPIDDG